MVRDGLPEGWATEAIGDVLHVNPRKPPKDALPPDTPVTFVPMPAVDAESGAITAPQERPFAKVRSGFTSFRDDDVIVAKITPCMENGKAAIARSLANGFGFGSTEFHVLRPIGAMIPEYVYHFVRQKSFRKKAESNMSGSVGQKRVPADFVKSADLPVPPLAEQKWYTYSGIIAPIGRSAWRTEKPQSPVVLRTALASAPPSSMCSGQSEQ